MHKSKLTSRQVASERRRENQLALENYTIAMVLAEMRKKPKHRSTTVMTGGEMSGILIGNLRLEGDAVVTGTVIGDLTAVDTSKAVFRSCRPIPPTRATPKHIALLQSKSPRSTRNE